KTHAFEKIASVKRCCINEPPWLGESRSELDNINLKVAAEPHAFVSVVEYKRAFTERLSHTDDFLPQALPRLFLASCAPQKGDPPFTRPDRIRIDSQACDKRDRSATWPRDWPPVDPHCAKRPKHSDSDRFRSETFRNHESPLVGPAGPNP